VGRKQGIVEIRLDRRQAFYALVGLLLVLSVAFVTGVIVGQRMRLPDGAELGVAANPGSGEQPVAEFPQEPSPELTSSVSDASEFTFYDALTAEPPRPRPVLSAPETQSAEQAVRALERSDEPAPLALADAAEPAPEPAALATPAPPALEERQPEVAESAPAQPTGEVAPEAPPVEVESEPRARAEAPADGPDTVRRIERRSIVRVAAAPNDRSTTGGPAGGVGYYTVETGRFASFGEANALRRQLQSSGHDAIVTIVGHADARRYRVQVGSFTRRTDAAAMAADLAAEGIAAEVVQEG
jgi:cell division protein FtsN